MDRREFMKGAALGVGAGVLGSMGLYSYSPLRRAFLPEVKRGTADIGVCKSVKVTNISETSWFDNGIFMNDVTGAGGLLVDQYTFNWAPFGNGKGVGKGTFEEGLKRIKHLLPHKIDEAWAIAKENCVHADNAGGYSCLVEIESMEGEIPQAMYDVRMDEMVNDFAFRVEQQGLRLEDYLKYMGQSMEQFRAAFMPQAEKQVKIRLALEAVAAAENIEASEEEVSAEIKRIADQYKMEEDKVRELVNVDDLKKDLAINKAIDFIKSHANIVEKAAEEEKAADAE